MPAILQYEFMLRALASGILIGTLAPTLGMFIVLRRFALIAETLSHVALMGVAVGLITQTFPTVVALVAARPWRRHHRATARPRQAAG